MISRSSTNKSLGFTQTNFSPKYSSFKPINCLSFFYTKKTTSSAVRNSRGFTLVETLVGTAVFLVIALSVYETYNTVIRLITLNKEKAAALNLSEELIEIARNTPFGSIGVISGIPAGIFPHVASFSRSGFIFQATTTVRSIDDVFDGTIGGAPNDTVPADYKLFEIEVGCSLCKNFIPLTVTATIAPKNLETTSGNGALFVRVIDANGQPVSEATVKVKGLLATSTVDLSDLTNNSGYLQLVDVPPGNFAYRVSVSKSGYSSSTSYASTDIGGSIPITEHPTISAGQVTQVTFAIDKTNNLTFRTVDETCAAVPNVPISVSGSKLIGQTPDLYKWSSSFTTDSSGVKGLPGMEWDTYSVALGSGFVLGGSMPFLPLFLSPGGSTDEIILAKPLNPNSLLVIVKDAANGFLPLSNATVSISGPTSKSLVTNRGFILQTDWSGGGGQTLIGSLNSFSSSDGNIDSSSVSGQVGLLETFGAYPASGELSSSWFDLGVATTTLYSLSWAPGGQPASTTVSFQLESANDYTGATTGLLGPDGTSATYYTVPDTPIPAIHTNQRYHRYKMYLATDDASTTPIVSDISLTFGTDCVPHGQAYFDGLPGGTYTVTVSKSGFITFTDTAVSVSANWQALEVNLSP